MLGEARLDAVERALTGVREDFDALVAPLVRWAHETTARVPMTD